MLRDSQITIFRFLLKKKGPIKTPGGTIPGPRFCEPEILNTLPVTITIEKLELLKSSRQAIGGDYLLLGYLLQSRE